MGLTEKEAEFMNYKYLKFGVENKIATITLNRPEKLNAWNDEIKDGLNNILLECDEDDEVRVIVITGAGRAFCAGADLKKGGSTFRGKEVGKEDRATSATTIYPFMIKKPVIAAINGHAIGVGITYPMTCDIRIVAEDAKIAFPFVRLGIIPEFASHWTVARVAGLSTASYLFLSGKTISGREFTKLGLALKCLPASEVLPAALEIAEDIAINTAPVSVAISKQLLWEGLTMSIKDMIPKEYALFYWAGNQYDAMEGIESFLKKRNPEWKLSPAKDFPRDLF